MRAKDIQYGKLYIAVVEGKQILVRVDKLLERMGWFFDFTYRVRNRKWLTTDYRSGDELVLSNSQIKSLVEGRKDGTK